MTGCLATHSTPASESSLSSNIGRVGYLPYYCRRRIVQSTRGSRPRLNALLPVEPESSELLPQPAQVPGHDASIIVLRYQAGRVRAESQVDEQFVAGRGEHRQLISGAELDEVDLAVRQCERQQPPIRAPRHRGR